VAEKKSKYIGKYADIIYEVGSMMIDKLGGLNPLNDVLNTQRTAAPKNVRGTGDTISVSPEAKARAEAYYLAQVAAETPDVRVALIEEIRQRIQDPGYLNAAVVNSVADKILDSFGM
jgi:negative regulator of flagellin synthesis FlgM